MNSLWLWTIIGIIVIIAIAAIAMYHPAGTGSGGPGTTGQVEQNIEENINTELNVTVPEVNEQIVDVNLPQEI